MTDTNSSKRLIQSYLEALSGQPKTAGLVARFVADEALAEHIRQVEAAFPAYEVIPVQIVAEGDLVAVRATFRGVHRGVFAGIEATGTRAATDFMIVYRIDNGRIAEHWLHIDFAGLVAQVQQAAAVTL